MTSTPLRLPAPSVLFAGFANSYEEIIPLCVPCRLQKGVASFVPLLVHRYANLNARIQDTSLQVRVKIHTEALLGQRGTRVQGHCAHG